MTLRIKIMGMMTVAMLLLLFSTLAYHYSRTKETNLYNEAYRENNEISISSILKFKENELEKTASDYSVWDDMVNFVNSSDQSWAKDNIEASIYTLDMSIAAVYSADYSLIYSIQDSNNFGNERFTISSADIKSAFASKKNCHFFLFTPQGMMEIAGSPIVPSTDVDKISPPVGYLIWGRLWNQEFIANLENSCNANIEVIPLTTYADLKIIKNSKNLNNNAITLFFRGSMGNKIARIDFLSKNQFQLKQSYFYFYTLIPEQTYPKKQINMITARIDSLYRANKSLYDKAVADGDRFYNTYEFDKAVDAYTDAANFLPMEKYPREMIVKIRRTIAENAIADVLKETVTITSNTEKQFPFPPVNIASRKNNFVYIKIKNLSGKSFNVLMRYGKDKQANGGVVMRNLNIDGNVNERLVSVRDQDLWSREDNNWISLYPQGGDVEVSFIQVSRAKSE